jgi:hypothetical protein
MLASKQIIEDLAIIEAKMQQLDQEINLQNLCPLEWEEYAQAIAELHNEVQQWADVPARPAGYLRPELPRVFIVQQRDSEQNVLASFAHVCDNAFQAIDAGFERWAPDVHPGLRSVRLMHTPEGRRACSSLRDGTAVVIIVPENNAR